MPAAGEDDVCGRPPGGRTTLRGPGEASCASERQAAGMAAPGRGDRAAQVSSPESRGPSSRCGNSVVVGFEFENCHLDSPSSERADLGHCLPATPPPAPAHSRPLRAHRLLPWEGSTHPAGTESSRPPDRERPGHTEHGAHAAPTRHVLRRHRATGSALRTQLRAADCVMRAHGHVSGSPGMECLAQHFLSHARQTRDLAVPGVGQHACAGRGAKTPRRVAACARGARGGPTRTPAERKASRCTPPPFDSESCHFSTGRSPCASGDTCRPWGRGGERPASGTGPHAATTDRSP